MPLDDNSAKKMEVGFKQLVGDRAIGRTILKEGSRTIEGNHLNFWWLISSYRNQLLDLPILIEKC